jgi:hypothetical protein
MFDLEESHIQLSTPEIIDAHLDPFIIFSHPPIIKEYGRVPLTKSSTKIVFTLPPRIAPCVLELLFEF